MKENTFKQHVAEFYVSIHILPEGRMKGNKMNCKHPYLGVSIHILPEGRMKAKSRFRTSSWSSFNPHPSRRKDERVKGLTKAHSSSVSIHILPEGRMKAPSMALNEFNRRFNPHPSRRKDERYSSQKLCITHTSFNPHPSRRKDESLYSERIKPRDTLFQSTSFPKEG